MSRVEDIERAIQELSSEEFAQVAQRVRAIQQLRADVMAGFDAIERGDFEEFDDSTTKNLADDIKRRGRQRHAEARITASPRKPHT